MTSPDHSAEPGLRTVVSNGATSATTTNASTISAPAIAVGLRRSRRQAPRQRLTPLVVGGAARLERRGVAGQAGGDGDAHWTLTRGSMTP